MSIYLLANILLMIGLFVLGLAVMIKDRTVTLNRVFAQFAVFVSIWSFANYISNDLNNPAIVALRANYFVFLFSFLAAFYLLRFSVELTNDKIFRKITKYSLPIIILTAAISPTPLVIKGVHEQTSVYGVDFGILAPLYFLVLLLVLFFAFFTLVNNLRKNKSDIEKRRIRSYLYALSFSLPLVLLSNFILPAFIGWFGLSNIASLSMLIMVIMLYYSVIIHKMFDLRALIIRAVAYILSSLVLAVFYSFVSFYVIKLLTDDKDTGLVLVINIVVISIILAVYVPLRRFFNKVTNRLFFRDSYDPQEFLDQLNKNIVSNIEIGILLRHTNQIIQQNLKCTYCSFLLHETDNEPMRMIGENQKLDQSDMVFIKDNLSTVQAKIIKKDDLSEENKTLHKLFDSKDIEFLVHLKASSYGDEQTVAYMLIGPKSSGNMYSGADYRIIDIIADEMVIAIQNALRFEEIQEFNVTLQKKVNDATGKLKRTNEKLKALDETKDEFISMASHQLRTPLTSVKGYLSMVLEGDAGDVNDNQRKLLDQAFVSSQRMVYLISDLLNVSRLRTGKFVIDSHPTNLADVVESEIAQLKEQARGKNQNLDFDKPKDFPMLMLDETKIRQVIMNFADNALFYTPNGGKIRIELKEDKGHIYFMVKDNGIGVPKDDQKHMFNKFYRAKNARNARPDGTGLGLFMAKKVITAQGGNVLFESTEGKGSMFGFSFNKKHLASSNKEQTDQSLTTS